MRHRLRGFLLIAILLLPSAAAVANVLPSPAACSARTCPMMARGMKCPMMLQQAGVCCCSARLPVLLPRMPRLLAPPAQALPAPESAQATIAGHRSAMLPGFPPGIELPPRSLTR